jgi:hypothetical protein
MVGSSLVVVGAVPSSRADGRARWRREAWPEHGGRARSIESGSSTKGQ